MWRLSRLKSRFLRKLNGIDIVIFWSKCDSIPILYHPRDAGGHSMGFTPRWVWPRWVWSSVYICESNHAELRGLLYLQLQILGQKKLKSNQHRILYYPRESEGICFHRRWFVCVCVSVTMITIKMCTDLHHIFSKVPRKKGKTKFVFVTIGRGMWK